VRLLRRMVAYLDCDGRVCLRGRHAKAVAWIERVSTHLDRSLLERLWETWPVLKLQLISKINRQFGVYEGTVFKQKSFARLVKFKGWPWPLTPTGLLATDNETFRDMSKLHPELEPLRQLRASLHQLRGQQLVIGKDDRNRVSLFSFGAVTGRNTPKASQFVFSPAVWLRGLIRPEPGFAMVYLDWSAEEFAIAAVLSGDSAMIETYNSGDPYLYLVKQLGMAPEHATKHTHRPIREMFKTICLAINYGMGPSTLAIRIGRSAAQARDILDRIHAMYPKFWKWKEGVHEHAVANKCFYTVYGWKMRCSAATNPRTIGNFPAQGNGAELLRLACCLATEAGVRVAAAVHDALLIEFPIAKLDEHVGLTIAAMRQASRYVLDGFELRVSGHNQPIVYPQRFSDERGVTMWNTVMELLDERQAA